MPAPMQHPAEGRAPASLRPTWCEIDLGAVAHNTRELRRLIGKGVAIYGCLKRNAYGCGAAAVGRTVMAAGGDGLAVGNVDDAVAVRNAGVAGSILLYPTCVPEVAAAVAASSTALRAARHRGMAPTCDRRSARSRPRL
jgi:alanine racemase